MAPSTPDLTPRREAWPHPPRDPGPRCPGSGVHGPAHLLQPFHAAGRCLVASLVDPCARGETTGRQARPGFWALRARGRECRKGVPLGCSVLIPRRLSRLLAECRAWNLEREGERAGWAVGPGSQRARAGAGLPRALGGPKGAGRRWAQAFHSLSWGSERAADQEAGKWTAALVFEPLFSGWKGNDGRGQPSGCSHTCPAVCLPAGPGPLTAPCLWPCSVLAPVPLPLRLLPTVCAPSHLPGRPNTEGLSNASVVDKLGGQDRECSGHGGEWSSHWLMAATLPLGPPRVPPSHPLVRGGWREPKPPCACPCTAAVSLANIPQSTLWGQGPIPAARGLLRADAALPSATALQAGAPWFGRKVTWQALLSLCS